MADEPISAEAGGVDAGHSLALRPGTRLGDRYVVLRLLADASDFALTYLAHDSRADAAVVVKELLPRGLVGRSSGHATRPHSPDAEREFARVLRRFVREGEVLADLRHPALPAATDVVEDLGTAYLVMPRHDAMRLGDYLPTVGGRLATNSAVAFTEQLLGGLEVLHAEGILHREVSPNTVHVRPDGSPLLLGLGAWRHVPGRSREPVAGFDPIEQYAGRDVGPWSDVYGAAAVLYTLVTGNAPVSAIERAGGAQLRSPGVWARDVSPPMASAMMRGLSLAPDGRPHSAAEFRRQLEEAALMGSESSLPRAMAALPTELTISPTGGPAGAGYHDEEPVAVPFTLNSFGVVVPRADTGMDRTLKRVADVAARLTRRRPAEDEEPAPALVEAPQPPPTAAGRRLDPVYDAAHARAVPSDEGTAVLDPAFGVAPQGTAVARTTDEPPATALVPTGAEATELVASSAARVLVPAPRRRTPWVVGVVLALLALAAAITVPTALRARASAGAADGRVTARPIATPVTAAARPAPTPNGPPTDSLPVAPQGIAMTSGSTTANASTAAGGATTANVPRPAERASASQSSRAQSTPASRSAEVPRLPDIAAPVLSLPSAPSSSNTIAADVAVDARSRVSVAGEQADQGNYAAALRTLADALARLDSAAARASDSESLRGVRREIEAARKRTADACGAESELRRRHGQAPLTCS